MSDAVSPAGARPTQSTRVAVFNSIAPPPFVGGAERSTKALCEQLVAAGFDVTFVGLVPPGSAETQEVSNGLTYRRLPIPNLYWPWEREDDPRALARVAWHLIDMTSRSLDRRVGAILAEADVVVTNNLTGLTGAPWRAAAARGLPVVHLLRDYSLMCVRATRYRAGRNCERACAPCRLRTGATRARWSGGTVAAISRAVFDVHESAGLFVGEDPVIIPPEVGAPPPELASTRANRAGALRFGTLGQVVPEKGTDVFAEAASLVNVPAIVAGRVAPAERERLAPWSDTIQMRGPQDRWEFLSDVDVLVVPSLWREPYGRVVAEAAAMDRGVIVSDMPGLREAAERSGARWRDFPAGDAAALAAVMSDVMATGRWWQGTGAPEATGDLVELLTSLTRSARTP